MSPRRGFFRGAARRGSGSTGRAPGAASTSLRIAGGLTIGRTGRLLPRCRYVLWNQTILLRVYRVRQEEAKLVTRHTAPHFGYAAEYWRRHKAITRPDQSEREGPLAPGVALVMIVLLSLGFWGVIWLAVSSLI